MSPMDRVRFCMRSTVLYLTKSISNNLGFQSDGSTGFKKCRYSNKRFSKLKKQKYASHCYRPQAGSQGAR